MSQTKGWQTSVKVLSLHQRRDSVESITSKKVLLMISLILGQFGSVSALKCVSRSLLILSPFDASHRKMMPMDHHYFLCDRTFIHIFK